MRRQIEMGERNIRTDDHVPETTELTRRPVVDERQMNSNRRRRVTMSSFDSNEDVRNNDKREMDDSALFAQGRRTKENELNIIRLAEDLVENW